MTGVVDGGLANEDESRRSCDGLKDKNREHTSAASSGNALPALLFAPGTFLSLVPPLHRPQ